MAWGREGTGRLLPRRSSSGLELQCSALEEATPALNVTQGLHCVFGWGGAGRVTTELLDLACHVSAEAAGWGPRASTQDSWVEAFVLQGRGRVKGQQSDPAGSEGMAALIVSVDSLWTCAVHDLHR